MHPGPKHVHSHCVVCAHAGKDPKAAALSKELTRVHDESSRFDTAIGALFDTFVAKQSRDRMAVVRRDVLEALGRWMVACPASFMVDLRLKHLAWGMSDVVRAA